MQLETTWASAWPPCSPAWVSALSARSGLPNPYRSGAAEPGSDGLPGARALRYLAWGFGLYSVIGQGLFYARVALAYGGNGPEAVRDYFSLALILFFLSGFGAACLMATFVYTYRRTRIRPTIALLLVATLALLALLLVAYYTGQERWVHSIGWLFELAAR